MKLKSGEYGTSESHEDTSKELAAWLKDVGLRRWPASPSTATGESAAATESCEDVVRYLEELAGTRISSRADVRRCFGELWAKDREAGRIYRKRQIVREALMLVCLAMAYIQYNFWDVSLQIACLPATIVFVPVEADSAAAASAKQASSVGQPRIPASVRGI